MITLKSSKWILLMFDIDDDDGDDNNDDVEDDDHDEIQCSTRITKYPAQTREKLKAACPYCLGNCNCNCTKMLSQYWNNCCNFAIHFQLEPSFFASLLITYICYPLVDHLEIDAITKLKRLLYLIHKVSPLIWNIDLENTFELQAEMEIRGTKLTSDDT